MPGNDQKDGGTKSRPEENVVELLTKHRDEQRGHTLPERFVGWVTQSLSTVWSVYLHILIFGLWVLAGSHVLPFRSFDPDLKILTLLLAFESIFITSFVLIAQRRMQELADMRANLTLHISLLEERENTRLMHLVTRMSEKLGIKVDGDEELAELMEDVSPEKILKNIEEQESSKGGG